VSDEMAVGNSETRDVTADMLVPEQESAIIQPVFTVGRAQHLGSSVCLWQSLRSHPAECWLVSRWQ